MSELTETLTHRPKRADARRNYDRLIEAARAAFAELGGSASLEEIARRADVGIGTLYRHFPTRQALIEAVYVEEVAALARSAADVADLEPWDAVVAWFRRFVQYALTKRVLVTELVATVGREADVFQRCRLELQAAGEPLLERAQEAGVVRPDAQYIDVARMVAAIAVTPVDAEQVERMLELALDGLRYRAA
jgi:AcrR family transcriptional regulator